MTIEVCNNVHVKWGQCLRQFGHKGRHFWRAEMDRAVDGLQPQPLIAGREYREGLQALHKD